MIHAVEFLWNRGDDAIFDFDGRWVVIFSLCLESICLILVEKVNYYALFYNFVLQTSILTCWLN